MMINVFNVKKLATWPAIVPTKDVLTVMIMAMLQQIAPTQFHPQAYQHKAETTTPEDVTDPHLGITIVIDITTVTIEIGTGSADLDLASIIPDIGVTVAVTLTEVALDPFTDPHTAAHHATEAQAHTITDKTLHTADPHHAGVSPEITLDTRTHTPCKNHHKTSTRPSSSSDQTTWKTKDRKYKQVTIDDPPSEYYSSDE